MHFLNHRNELSKNCSDNPYVEKDLVIEALGYFTTGQNILVAQLTKFLSMTSQLPIKYRQRTIARDLVSRLVLALSASLLIAGVFSFIYQVRADRNDLRIRLATSASNLASLMAFPVWTYNESEIKALAGTHGLDEGISSVKVLDEDGKAIAEVKKIGKSNDIKITRDITYKGKKIGKVTVGASTNSLYLNALRALISTVLLTLLSIVVVILLVLPLVQHFLELPLNKLVHGIQKIASGQYKEKLPPVPQKELAKITDEVNFMADKIASRERQIIETMQSATLLKAELGIAETLQRSMSATRGFNTARRVAQHYQPVSNLSGDWMTVFECDKGRTIYALVGDVTGHGIPQGLVTMAAFGAIQTLRPLIQQNSKSFSPATILNILRSTLVTLLHECQLAMTVSILKIDIASRQVTMSSAGHPFPLVVRPNGNLMKIVPLGAKAQSPLGFEFQTKTTAPPPYRDTLHNLEPDDAICIFSDGLTEARSKSEKSFQRPFVKMLRSLDRRYPPSVLVDRILQKFQMHMEGSTADDDICLMVIDTRRDDGHEAVA